MRQDSNIGRFRSALIGFCQRFYLALILFFLYAPIIVLMVLSFNNSKSRVTWTGFTFDWYAQLFQNEQIMSALYVTVAIAVLSAIIATVLGTTAAIGIHDMKKWRKTAVMEVSYLPVVSPDIVIGLSLMLLFVFAAIPNGFLTLLLAHITFCTPYVILSVMPKLNQMNKHLYESALDLGAKPMVALWKIVMPQLRPGIITGMILAFTISLDDFVVSFFTSGAGVENLSVVIYSMARKGVNPQINAISTLMFVAVLVLLVVVNKRQRKDTGRGLF